MTATVPDVGAIEHLDFQPSCQHIRCNSGHPAATHVLRAIPCGCVIPICDPCTERCLRYLHEESYAWKCTACQQVFRTFEPRPMSDEVRIEPLP